MGMRLVVSMVLAAALAACGGDDNGPGGDGPGDDVDIDAAFDQTGIPCGEGGRCTAGTEECCFEGEVASCVATGTCAGTSLRCDGAEDCATDTQSCCIAGAGTLCRSPSLCDSFLCNSDDDCPGPEDARCCDQGQCRTEACRDDQEDLTLVDASPR